jgi:hypothetical protein
MKYLLIVLLALTACATGRQRDPRFLTSTDSTELHVQAISSTLTLLEIPAVNRLWLRGSGPRDNRRELSPISEELAAAVQRRFPNARVAAPDQRLFLCPPGVSVQLPGQGCPILDDGVIVMVGWMRSAGDGVTVNATVIQSKGSSTWAESITALFRRARLRWQFVRVTERSIT